jgi:hypothetical protein
MPQKKPMPPCSNKLPGRFSIKAGYLSGLFLSAKAGQSSVPGLQRLPIFRVPVDVYTVRAKCRSQCVMHAVLLIFITGVYHWCLSLVFITGVDAGISEEAGVGYE